MNGSQKSHNTTDIPIEDWWDLLDDIEKEEYDRFMEQLDAEWDAYDSQKEGGDG